MLDKKDKLISIIGEFKNLAIAKTEERQIVIKHLYKPLILTVSLMKSTATIYSNHNSYWKHITTLKKFKEAIHWMSKE